MSSVLLSSWSDHYHTLNTIPPLALQSDALMLQPRAHSNPETCKILVTTWEGSRQGASRGIGKNETYTLHPPQCDKSWDNTQQIWRERKVSDPHPQFLKPDTDRS